VEGVIVENKTMSLTEEIYQELVDGLKTGLNWTAFIAKYSASKGPLYNAIGRFLNDMETEVIAANEKLSLVQRELDGAGVKLDQAGLKLNQLDQEIKEAESRLAPLEERRNVLNKQVETLETKLAEKSEVIKQVGELGKLGFDIERLRQLREVLAEIGAKHGLKGKEAVGKFFHDLKDYEAVLGAEALLEGLKTKIEAKNLEAENWQAKEEALRRKHDDLKEAIGAIYALRAKDINVRQIIMWQRILNRFETLEQFAEDLSRYGDLTKLLNTRKEETEGYDLRLAQVQSQVETLDKERTKIEAAIDALKVDGVKELKGMTEAAGNQLKALAATQIRDAQVVGQEVRKGLDNLFAQLDALGAKAIEVGRTVGTVQEQLKGDTKARDILNLLQNPTSAGYEDYATLVLPLARAMRIWVNENKSKFTLPYRIDEGLKALSDNLGGS
jgi:chromosome segregation ATPase